MKWVFRVAVVLGVLNSGASFAEEGTDVARKLAVVNASEVEHCNRSEMIEQKRETDVLREQVRALKRQLAESPKYFDDPLSDPLRP